MIVRIMPRRALPDWAEHRIEGENAYSHIGSVGAADGHWVLFSAIYRSAIRIPLEDVAEIALED